MYRRHIVEITCKSPASAKFAGSQKCGIMGWVICPAEGKLTASVVIVVTGNIFSGLQYMNYMIVHSHQTWVDVSCLLFCDIAHNYALIISLNGNHFTGPLK